MSTQPTQIEPKGFLHRVRRIRVVLWRSPKAPAVGISSAESRLVIWSSGLFRISVWFVPAGYCRFSDGEFIRT